MVIRRSFESDKRSSSGGKWDWFQAIGSEACRGLDHEAVLLRQPAARGAAASRRRRRAPKKSASRPIQWPLGVVAITQAGDQLDQVLADDQVMPLGLGVGGQAGPGGHGEIDHRQEGRGAQRPPSGVRKPSDQADPIAIRPYIVSRLTSRGSVQRRRVGTRPWPAARASPAATTASAQLLPLGRPAGRSASCGRPPGSAAPPRPARARTTGAFGFRSVFSTCVQLVEVLLARFSRSRGR